MAQSTQPTSCQRPSPQSKERSKTPPPSRSGPVVPAPRPASTRHSSRSTSTSPPRPGASGPAVGSSEPITACAPEDCHHGAVSTQWASTERTFHSRPCHRNCSGPSTPVTQPLRTSTGSSYRLTWSSSLSTPTDPTPARRGRGSRSPPPGVFEQMFELRERYTPARTGRQGSGDASPHHEEQRISVLVVRGRRPRGRSRRVGLRRAWASGGSGGGPVGAAAVRVEPDAPDVGVRVAVPQEEQQ